MSPGQLSTACFFRTRMACEFRINRIPSPGPAFRIALVRGIKRWSRQPTAEARWQQWYEQNRDHQWAWQQVENLRQQMGQLPGPCQPGAQRQSSDASPVLKGLMLLVAAGGGWQMWTSELAEGLRADYRTAKGLPRGQTLNDGTLLTLNTDSAADVRFDDRLRTVRLRYGEIAVTTPVTADSDRFASRPAMVYLPRWAPNLPSASFPVTRA